MPELVGRRGIINSGNTSDSEGLGANDRFGSVPPPSPIARVGLVALKPKADQ